MDNIKNIILDFDGTLVDTAPLIIATMQATISEMGLPPRTDLQCKSTIGLRLAEISGDLWPELKGLSDEYARTYRRIFEEKKLGLKAECFPGVEETLRTLHKLGFNLSIASSRSRKSLVDYAEHFNMAELFTELIGGDDVSNGKPSPDPVFAITEKHGWRVENTLVVGDTLFDIEMGKEAKAKTCAVTYGNQTREQLASGFPDATIETFSSLLPVAAGVNPEIVEYVERIILPRYDNFDKAHRRGHAEQVIAQSIALSLNIRELNRDMVYVAAAFHDLGLANGREHHHIDSAKIIRSDTFLKEHFSSDEISVMADAAEDHRASNARKPRNDYGLIVAEADRFIDPDTIVRRTVQYGLANYPELDERQHFERTLNHLKEKYGPEGYLRIWIPWSDNAERLKRLHSLIADEAMLRQMFLRIFKEERASIKS